MYLYAVTAHDPGSIRRSHKQYPTTRENRLDHVTRIYTHPTKTGKRRSIDFISMSLCPLRRSRHRPASDRYPLRWSGNGYSRKLQRDPDEPYNIRMVHWRLRILKRTIPLPYSTTSKESPCSNRSMGIITCDHADGPGIRLLAISTYHFISIEENNIMI